jgi:hypothetical protein
VSDHTAGSIVILAIKATSRSRRSTGIVHCAASMRHAAGVHTQRVESGVIAGGTRSKERLASSYSQSRLIPNANATPGSAITGSSIAKSFVSVGPFCHCSVSA